MSLLGRDTVSVLGIGTHGVKDFADGVNARRKHLSEVSFAQTQYQAKVAPTLTRKAQLDRTVNGGSGKEAPANKVSVAEVDGSRLHLNQNDKEFIQKLNEFSGIIQKGLGSNHTSTDQSNAYRREVQNLLHLAENSSRGNLAEVWSGALAAMSSSDWRRGKFSPEAWANVSRQFESALAETNKVLDTYVNLDTYKFEAGRTADQLTHRYANYNMFQDNKAITGVRALAYGSTDKSYASLNPILAPAPSSPLQIARKKQGGRVAQRNVRSNFVSRLRIGRDATFGG